jgi:Common central domain of tyrosinase
MAEHMGNVGLYVTHRPEQTRFSRRIKAEEDIRCTSDKLQERSCWPWRPSASARLWRWPSRLNRNYVCDGRTSLRDRTAPSVLQASRRLRENEIARFEPHPTSADGTVEDQISYLQSNGLNQYVKYCNGIKDQPAPESIAQSIWATCEHSYTDQQGNLHQANLPGWHRMYVYYFERVLRWAAQDDTLRLPYWDYTDPKQEILPVEFRKTSSPIYDAKRNPKVNNGSAALNPSSTNIDDSLSNTDYLPAELSMEDGVHGYFHCTVGRTCPVAHMGGHRQLVRSGQSDAGDWQ